MNQRQRTILGILLACVLLGGGWIHISVVSNRRQALEDLRQEAQQLRTYAGVGELAEQVALLHEAVLEHEAALPAQGGIGALLHNLGQDLSDLNVSDRSLTTGTPNRTAVVEQIPLDLSFKGSFTSVFELLRRLDKYDRIVRVERIAVNRESNASVGALSVHARLVTFARIGPEVQR